MSSEFVKLTFRRRQLVNYIYIINKQLSTHTTEIAKRKFIFQQDNLAVYTTKVLKVYIDSKEIDLLIYRHGP